MVRRLPTPRTPADEYAAATYDLLGELVSAVGTLTGMLRDRLPDPQRGEPVTGPVRLTEPARPPEPAETGPVRLTEPEPVPESEPEPKGAPETIQRTLPEPPPRAGRGSSLDVWRTFAEQSGVRYGLDDKRDDIIAACERAGVIPAQEG